MNTRTSNYGSISSSSAEVSANIPDINTLRDKIVTNIYTINQNGRLLETSFNSLSTNKDNVGMREKIRSIQLKTNEIISNTNNDVKNVSKHAKKADKNQRLQIEKLTGNFKDALARYSQIQTHITNEMKHYRLTEEPEVQYVIPENPVLYQTQAVAEQDIAFEHDMLLEREQRVEKIETDILTINEIMREINALTNEQGEMIDGVESQIEYTAGNVDEAATELLRGARYQSSYRRKLCFLITLIVIIIIILIVIIVLSFR